MPSSEELNDDDASKSTTARRDEPSRELKLERESRH
jgi:hypothetical protein